MVPQESILEPILFIAFINNLLLFINKIVICNFMDDTTLYACGKKLDVISNKQQELETKIAIKWLKDNKMVANPSKFQHTFLSLKKNIF